MYIIIPCSLQLLSSNSKNTTQTDAVKLLSMTAMILKTDMDEGQGCPWTAYRMP